MERLLKPISIGTVFVLVALMVSTPVSVPVTAQEADLPTVVAVNAPVATASLHNAGFDNHDWYEFDLRYQSAYPSGAWLPDDDNNVDNNIPENVRQDWRLWFQHGTAIVDVDPEQTYQHMGSEAVQIRPYSWSLDTQIAGLYQVIYNTIPGRVYEFQIYAQSRPEGSGDYLTALQVGIEPTGWHPPSATDPAVHSFPATMKWGPSSTAYLWYYGPLAVIAEARSTSITVFTYADAKGGNSHRILWDTASFQEVSSLIPDPDNPPAPDGISNLAVVTSTTAATVTWNTAYPALGQVYYRQISCPSTPVSPTESMTYTVYLPLVSRYVGWSTTALNKDLLTAHSEMISGLQPGCTYEYIVASRGVAGGQCTTWVSDKWTFVTAQ